MEQGCSSCEKKLFPWGSGALEGVGFLGSRSRGWYRVETGTGGQATWAEGGGRWHLNHQACTGLGHHNFTGIS